MVAADQWRSSSTSFLCKKMIFADKMPKRAWGYSPMKILKKVLALLPAHFPISPLVKIPIYLYWAFFLQKSSSCTGRRCWMTSIGLQQPKSHLFYFLKHFKTSNFASLFTPGAFFHSSVVTNFYKVTWHSALELHLNCS